MRAHCRPHNPAIRAATPAHHSTGPLAKGGQNLGFDPGATESLDSIIASAARARTARTKLGGLGCIVEPGTQLGLDGFGDTARAGNHRFWLLSAQRARKKAPYKNDLHRETLSALNRPGGPGQAVVRRDDLRAIRAVHLPATPRRQHTARRARRPTVVVKGRHLVAKGSARSTALGKGLSNIPSKIHNNEKETGFLSWQGTMVVCTNNFDLPRGTNFSGCSCSTAKRAVRACLSDRDPLEGPTKKYVWNFHFSEQFPVEPSKVQPHSRVFEHRSV